MEPHPRPGAEGKPSPPDETLADRMMTVGTWVVAVLAVVIVIFLVVFFVRWGLGDLEVVPAGLGALVV